VASRASILSFPPARSGYRCDEPHDLVALAEIEPPLRRLDFPLDANGFDHDRMVSVPVALQRDVSLTPIQIERADPGQRRYRARVGVHRYHALNLAAGQFLPAPKASEVKNYSNRYKLPDGTVAKRYCGAGTDLLDGQEFLGWREAAVHQKCLRADEAGLADACAGRRTEWPRRDTATRDPKNY
jgi:hypothetical protein